MWNLIHRDQDVQVVKDEIICHDEMHCHNSPVQQMIGIEVNGHWVEATKDGDQFHVRIDSNDETSKAYLSAQEANTYVELMTGLGSYMDGEA